MSQTKISRVSKYDTPRHVFQFALWCKKYFWKGILLWLIPHLQRFAPSTNLNPYLHSSKLPTPTYTVFWKKLWNYEILALEISSCIYFKRKTRGCRIMLIFSLWNFLRRCGNLRKFCLILGILARWKQVLSWKMLPVLW